VKKKQAMANLLSRGVVLTLALLVALVLEGSHALDKPRSFLRHTNDESTTLHEKILKGARQSVVAESSPVIVSAEDVKDKLRKLVETGVANTEGQSEDAVIDEVVPQIVEILISSAASLVITQLVTTLGASEDGPLGGALEDVINIAVTVIAGQLVTAIVAAILGNAEQRASFSNAFTRHRRLQFDTLLEEIVPQILEIIVSAIAGALVSAIVGAVGGGPVLEEVTSIIVLAVAGAIVAAIVAALFGGGEALSAVSGTFNRNLRGGSKFEDREERAADSHDPNHRELQLNTLLEDIGPQIIEIIVTAVAGALVSAIVGGIGGGPLLEEVTSIIVLAVAGAIVAAIVAALFGGGGEELASFVAETFNRRLQSDSALEDSKSGAVGSDDFNRRRLQLGPILEGIGSQVIQLIVGALAGALVSVIVGAIGGGPLLEEITSIIILAILGAIVSAIVSALFGGGGELAGVMTDTFNRNLQSEAATNTTSGEVQQDFLIRKIIRVIIIAIVLAAVLGGGSNTPQLASQSGGSRDLQHTDVFDLVDQLRRSLRNETDDTIQPAPKKIPPLPKKAPLPPSMTPEEPATAPLVLGDVEEETISEITSAAVTAIVDAVVAAVTQAIIDATLGILGIQPAVSESEVPEGETNGILPRLKDLMAKIPPLNSTALAALIDNVNVTSITDDLLASLNATSTTPNKRRELLRMDRDKVLRLLRSPLTGDARASESVEREPQGDTIGILVILIFRVAKAVIVALIIAAIVQAIMGSGEQPPPAALSDFDLDSLLSNSTVWNATYVAESIRSFSSRTILGIGGGDDQIVISTLFLRLLVALIVAPITFLLAALSGCLGTDQCLESDSILEGFSIGNVTELLSTTIGKLNVTLDTSALNATTLSGQILSILDNLE
jgi:hypothetical protein